MRFPDRFKNITINATVFLGFLQLATSLAIEPSNHTNGYEPPDISPNSEAQMIGAIVAGGVITITLIAAGIIYAVSKCRAANLIAPPYSRIDESRRPLFLDPPPSYQATNTNPSNQSEPRSNRLDNREDSRTHSPGF